MLVWASGWTSRELRNPLRFLGWFGLIFSHSSGKNQRGTSTSGDTNPGPKNVHATTAN